MIASCSSLCAPVKGHFSVSLPVDSDLAPIARLLIFAILPDGEMFGDSAKYDIENCLDNKVSCFYHNIPHLKLVVTITIAILSISED
jgi:hypothetical protein